MHTQATHACKHSNRVGSNRKRGARSLVRFGMVHGSIEDVGVWDEGLTAKIEKGRRTGGKKYLHTHTHTDAHTDAHAQISATKPNRWTVEQRAQRPLYRTESSVTFVCLRLFHHLCHYPGLDRAPSRKWTSGEKARKIDPACGRRYVCVWGTTIAVSWRKSQRSSGPRADGDRSLDMFYNSANLLMIRVI